MTDTADHMARPRRSLATKLAECLIVRYVAPIIGREVKMDESI